MKAPEDTQARARLWQALGYQPGVSAWFAVWSLARTRVSEPSVTVTQLAPHAACRDTVRT